MINNDGDRVRVSGPSLTLSSPLIVIEQEISDILTAIDAGLSSVKPAWRIPSMTDTDSRDTESR